MICLLQILPNPNLGVWSQTSILLIGPLTSYSVISKITLTEKCLFICPHLPFFEKKHTHSSSCLDNDDSPPYTSLPATPTPPTSDLLLWRLTFDLLLCCLTFTHAPVLHPTTSGKKTLFFSSMFLFEFQLPCMLILGLGFCCFIIVFYTWPKFKDFDSLHHLWSGVVEQLLTICSLLIEYN